ncbi:heat shock protein Hsp20 [Pontibacillus halophilus JSM 076056 = DSM 19796]|uniref:Heat shock protein Hsp20 n=1 Tax=Pontibacillus halophilus JSM 076056 = DSM 19796 TaxID=1385510 RepID=A0A0A5ID44_9BACI|nr:Hsp20/alpha crystallin family protein [Pontibacillus halophilus]KGX93762.1 heat shock protein Hsp20 [Pontibacillus halophilus JSM 076056 = DSM 19796]
MDKQKGQINWDDFSGNVERILGEHFWEDLHHVLPKRSPSYDLYEQQDVAFVIMELPGLTKQDRLSIQQQGNHLFIEGSIGSTYPVSEKQLIHNERLKGEFKRKISIPFPFKAEELQSSYKNGLLTIRIRKHQQKQDIVIDFEEESTET